MFRNTQDFYRSKKWEKFRELCMQMRTNEQGEIICADCKKPIYKKYDCIAHHIEELTVENVNNPEIALNQNNIEFICFKCHNCRHQRWQGQTLRKVFIVYGSPLGGKTSFVKENASKDDIVIDLDSIWQCFSINSRYIKPNTLKGFIFNVYNSAIESVTMRTGMWNNAWIIGSLPRVMERNRLATKLGAETIHIDTDKETCIARLYEDKDRELVREEYLNYIEEYWRNYQPDELISDRED